MAKFLKNQAGMLCRQDHAFSQIVPVHDEGFKPSTDLELLLRDYDKLDTENKQRLLFIVNQKVFGDGEQRLDLAKAIERSKQKQFLRYAILLAADQCGMVRASVKRALKAMEANSIQDAYDLLLDEDKTSLHDWIERGVKSSNTSRRDVSARLIAELWNKFSDDTKTRFIKYIPMLMMDMERGKAGIVSKWVCEIAKQWGCMTVASVYDRMTDVEKSDFTRLLGDYLKGSVVQQYAAATVLYALPSLVEQFRIELNLLIWASDEEVAKAAYEAIRKGVEHQNNKKLRVD